MARQPDAERQLLSNRLSLQTRLFISITPEQIRIFPTA
jgi:hypothetical protein